MRARSVDPTAEELLEQTGWLHALARSLVGEGADDLLQDAFVVALEHGRARGGPRAFGPWVAGILRNLARRSRRDEGRRRRRELEAPSARELTPDSDDALSRVELQRRLLERVLELDEPYRDAVVQRFFAGRTPAEIAARDGLAASTVRTRLARGLDRLRERLDEEHGGDRAAWGLALAPLLAPPVWTKAGGLSAGAVGGLAMGAKVRWVAVAALALAAAVGWRLGAERSAEEHAAPEAAPGAVALRAPGSGAPSPGALVDASGAAVPAREVVEPEPTPPELGALVFGSLVDGAGAPVDAWVRFVDERARVVHGQSSRLGSYTAIGLAPGRYAVSTRASGFLDRRFELEVPAGVESLRHDVELAQALSVPVRILDAQGDALLGAPSGLPVGEGPSLDALRLTVVATAAPPPARLHGVNGLDASNFGVGAYRARAGDGSDPVELGPEHAGLLELRAAPPVWVSLVARDTVVQTLRVDGPLDELVFRVAREALEAVEAGLKLRVIDAETGEPVTQAHVALSTRQSMGGGAAVDDEGRAELAGLAPGLYQLSVYSQGYPWHPRTIRLDPGRTTDLGDVRLARGGRVTGRVVDGSGAGVATLVTWVALRDGDMPQDAEGSWRIPTDADGAFSIDVPGGRVGFWIQDEAWAGEPAWVQVDPEGSAEVELRARPGVEVRFRPADGSRGARVGLADEAGRLFRSWSLDTDLPEVRRLVPGRYEVRVGWDEQVGARAELVVPSDGREELVFELPALEPAR